MSRFEFTNATKRDADRFMNFVQPEPNSGCWLWRGQIDVRGYGRFQMQRGDTNLAHRISYRMATGVLPKEKMVCHRCDNPGCVNPEHLWLGTQSENMSDAGRKGRLSKPATVGERVNTAKLNRDAVLEIRASRLPVAELAKLYGVSKEQIGNILNRRQWKHV